MKNYIQPGNIINLTAPAGGIASGEADLFGALFGVATTSADEGQKVAVSLEGVFVLPKVVGGAIAEGGKAYWNEADKKLTGTASGNTLVGHVTAAAAADAASVTVRIAN